MSLELKTNTVKFEESKMTYIFFIVINFLLIIGIVFFSTLIDATIYAGIGGGFISVYLFFVLNKFLYKWKFNYFTHMLLIASVVFFFIATKTGEMGSIIITGVLSIVPLIIFLLPLASFTYTMECHYNTETGDLQIIYDKLFTKILVKHNIPHGSTINLHSLLNPGFVRPLMFHSVSVGKQKKIFIAPLNANGFGLVGKIMELFDPIALFIDDITKTNAKIIFPPINKVMLSIPKEGTLQGTYPAEGLKEIMKLPSYKKQYPNKRKIAILKPILFIVIFLPIPFAIAYLIILSFQGVIEEAPQDALIYLILVTLILIIIIVIISLNILTITLGKQDFLIEENYYIIQYKLMFKTVQRKIHKAFNPLIRLDGNHVDLVIYGDNGSIFYQHRFGKVNLDELYSIPN